MNSMADAFKKANVTAGDFEDRGVDEKAIELDLEIEFMGKWLKLLERNASEKEKHNFVIEHGFVSVMQFGLYMSIMDDVFNLKEELEDGRYDLSDNEVARHEEEIAEKEKMAKSIRSLAYYKWVLRCTGKKDITPYGEDILKRKIC